MRRRTFPLLTCTTSELRMGSARHCFRAAERSHKRLPRSAHVALHGTSSEPSSRPRARHPRISCCCAVPLRAVSLQSCVRCHRQVPCPHSLRLDAAAPTQLEPASPGETEAAHLRRLSSLLDIGAPRQGAVQVREGANGLSASPRSAACPSSSPSLRSRSSYPCDAAASAPPIKAAATRGSPSPCARSGALGLKHRRFPFLASATCQPRFCTPREYLASSAGASLTTAIRALVPLLGHTRKEHRSTGSWPSASRRACKVRSSNGRAPAQHCSSPLACPGVQKRGVGAVSTRS